MILLPSLLTGGLALVLYARWMLFKYMKKNWEELCVYYVIEKKQDILTASNYIEVAPMYIMVMHLSIWDFKKFIVNQKDMHLILDFFTSKSTVNDNET